MYLHSDCAQRLLEAVFLKRAIGTKQYLDAGGAYHARLDLRATN